MNVLLVSGIYSPDIGGPATYIPKLARALQKQGHNVSIFSLTEPNVQIGMKNPGIESL